DLQRLLALAAATLLILGACSPSDTDPTTPTTSPATTITTTVTGANGDERQVVMPDCGAAPDEVRIVCEVVDLVLDNYVDEVSAEELANAAAGSSRRWAPVRPPSRWSARSPQRLSAPPARSRRSSASIAPPRRRRSSPPW